MVTLKALTYFKDGNLASLPLSTQERLRTAAEGVKLGELPLIYAMPGITRRDPK